MAIIARVQNVKLKNKSIITAGGTFSFNADGIILASKLPKELLYELCNLPGFKPLDKNGNEIINPGETNDKNGNEIINPGETNEPEPIVEEKFAETNAKETPNKK